MLDILKFAFICICCISSCLWTPLKANPLIILAQQEKNGDDVLLSQAEAIENSLDIHELIHLIVQLRDYMVSRGCYFPTLGSILDVCRDALREDGVEIDDAAFEALKAEFEKYDNPDYFGYDQIRHHHHRHKKNKKDKELKISSKMATGFLKFVGGSLLCLIPVPAIQGAGASLAIIGVSEMVDSARQESDKRELDQKMDFNRRIENELAR